MENLNENLTAIDSLKNANHLLPFGWEPFKAENGKQLLEAQYFKFEEIDSVYWQNLSKEFCAWSLYAAAAYFLIVFGLQRWMKRRSAYNLKGAIFLWNAILGIFSVVAFARTAPGLLKVLTKQDGEGGIYQSICEKKGADNQLLFWSIAAALSKFVELGDTVFLVLRKKPLTFLQSYHHLVAMFTAASIVPFAEPLYRWYMVLNCGVHSCMYPYFAAKALGIKAPKVVPNIIVTLQFAQMIAGCIINFSSMYFYLNGYNCSRFAFSMQVCSVASITFALLWGKFFMETVLTEKGKMSNEKQRKLK